MTGIVLRMPSTLRDVARAAGVHPATVSRALNPETRHLVNDGTAERVRRAADKLGYVPNPFARSLKTSRSGSVGVIIPDLTNPLFPPIMRGIEDVLSAAGFTALIANTNNDADREAVQVASMRSRQVEGFIIATARQHHPLLEGLVEQGFPLVLVNRRIEGLRASTVAGDDTAGLSLGVAHLVELGHRRIAHVAGPQWLPTGTIRLRAYRQALTDHGIEADDALVSVAESFRENDGKKALGELLDRGADFTAVIAGNDLLALGCYDAIAERKLRCPDDLSIVGFNDMPFVDKLSPPMTTVHIPHYNVGAEAARLLLERLTRGPGAEKSVLLPLSLVVRGSTAPPSSRALAPIVPTSGADIGRAPPTARLTSPGSR